MVAITIVCGIIILELLFIFIHFLKGLSFRNNPNCTKLDSFNNTLLKVLENYTKQYFIHSYNINCNTSNCYICLMYNYIYFIEVCVCMYVCMLMYVCVYVVVLPLLSSYITVHSHFISLLARLMFFF